MDSHGTNSKHNSFSASFCFSFILQNCKTFRMFYLFDLFPFFLERLQIVFQLYNCENYLTYIKVFFFSFSNWSVKNLIVCHQNTLKSKRKRVFFWNLYSLFNEWFISDHSQLLLIHIFRVNFSSTFNNND